MTNDQAELIARKTLADEVSERLRDDILSGTILPGDRILVRNLVKRFGVSHIPIREALRELEAEGLLQTSPQRATIVTGLALEDLHDLYCLRRLIEGDVAGRAAAGMTADHIATLRALLTELVSAESAGDPEAANVWTIHRSFHWAILEPGLTPWTRRVLEQLWQNAERYIRLHSTFGIVDESIRQHRQLLQACEERDGDALRNRLLEHLTGSEERVREGYLAMQRPHSD